MNLTRTRLQRSTGRARACLLATIAVFAGLSVAGTAHAVPSAVVSYASTAPAALDQYAAPGNVIVVPMQQRENAPARIKAWRAKGAIVLAYVNAIDWFGGDGIAPMQHQLYGSAGTFPSAWKYGSYSNFGGKPLLNLRSDCPVATFNGFTGTWGEYVADFVKNTVIKDGTVFNGVFLDVWGAKLYNVPDSLTGIGTPWEAGIVKWSQRMRANVGQDIYLVGNAVQSPATARQLNGRMWESFDGNGHNLTGDGPYPGLLVNQTWTWSEPRLTILWRNEANPSQATKDMLVASAKRAMKTSSDIAVGASDLQTGIPAPFGGALGAAPPSPVVPTGPTPAGSSPSPAAPKAPGSTVPPGGAGGAGSSPGATGGSGGTTAGGGTSKGGVGGSWKADELLRNWRSPGGSRISVIDEAAGRALRVRASLGRDTLLSTPIPSWTRLSIDASIRIGPMRASGRTPRLVSSVTNGGRRLAAGFARGGDGRLHWAMWRGGPQQPAHLAVSKETVRSGAWTGVSMSLVRDSRGVRRELKVDGRVVLAVRDPAGVGGGRVHVGLAGTGRRSWTGVVDVQQVGLSGLAA